MELIAFLVAAALILGLSDRILGGSTRMTLVVVVAAALLGLFVVKLR
jgi:hypothetical protein